ncbi:glycoside hydrolase family 5 [Pyrenophora seminiperda CCB06]|uniref:Glycoside hydrolase family 5 n=1 Tax=Pyrenophora seminiperda CCB06 TaxID=1302712 RepID=A0A3M7M8V3_9PLEO|nr:glycoside hydrolase family 5 [Pyrenophora seminiperda CCB06]
MTRRIHTTPSYAATVGIIQVVNEPQTGRDKGGMPQAEKDTLTQIYYPSALRAVRTAENDLGIPTSSRIHVQYMDTLWGAGDPSSSLPSDSAILFDDHNYVGGAVTATHPNAKQADYMWYTCYIDDRLADGDVPKLVGEWSLTVNAEYSSEFDWKNSANTAFYKQWFVAQQRLYERTDGWIFWSWRTQLNDPRWDYSYLVYKGWVPTDAAGLDASAQQDVCKAYFGTQRRTKRW